MRRAILVLTGLLGLTACHQSGPKVAKLSSAVFEKAEAFFAAQKADSAFYYFNQVATGDRDKMQVAMAYNYMAAIQSDAGDYYGAQESLTLSLSYLDEKDKEARYCLASDYNELGMTSIKLRNYSAAINYFNSALRFSDEESYRLVVLNNKANAYRYQKAYADAMAIYRQVLEHTTREGKNYPRLLTNMAITRWLQDSTYHPVPELLRALQMRKRLNDRWGQHSSYAHLSDYYINRADSGLSYANRTYRLAKELNSPDDQLTVLQKLIRLSPATDAKRYFLRYEQLNDSLQTARNAAKNQFALIRYESEKNKADNLRLQKENTEKEYRLFRHNLILVIILISVVAGSIIAIVWYKRRRQRLENEAQSLVRESQLKTSKKVHDVVANGLYRMMSEVENKPDVDKEQLLDQIEWLYDQSRDISYEQPAEKAALFHEQTAELLLSFATSRIKVVLSGNRKEFWANVQDDVKQELHYVLQELMVNMRKHSQATHVAWKFERKNQRVNIYYIDNGVGFPAVFPKNNGLNNTGTRMERIHGVITFGPNAKKGARIMISFPLA